jgi:cephalosporin-C deacetylase
MAFFDMPLHELQAYKPDRQEPEDFDAFWSETLAAARQHPLNGQLERVDYGLKTLEVYDATFAGYAGQPIKGWYILPAHREGPLPCVVEYLGYGGGRGLGLEHLLFPSAGFAYFLMDTRGQGGGWRQGDTPDLGGDADGGSPSVAGFMTRGILDPKSYYYRRLFTDAARALEFVRTLPEVDAERVAVTGASQGGGITIAAAALDGNVSALLPEVPFLCHYQRAVQMVDSMPYFEITQFCRSHRERAATVFNTLSYFDGMNFAPRIQAPALFSVGLMDAICPPSTVYAAFNHLAGPKQMIVYEFNEHEGGGAHHAEKRVAYLHDLWA